MEKEKELNEFGDLLYNVLWAQKPKLFIKRLEKMIIEKKQFSFSKEEFIKTYLIKSKRIGMKDKLGFFQLDFFNDSFDAVTFRTTDYSNILLLRERLLEFKEIINQ